MSTKPPMANVPLPPPATNIQVPSVHYVHAARRHMADAESLFANRRLANAGQLFGFVAECGIKALLIGCGIVPDTNGEIPQRHHFRQHVPCLIDRIVADGHLIPDGQRATQYLSSLAHLPKFGNWRIDHRYWIDAALPLASVEDWQLAAQEILQMMDKAKEDGSLI